MRWIALLPMLVSPAAGLSGTDSQVLVVSTSGVRPFDEAMEGLRSGFGGGPLPAFIDLKSPSADAELADAAHRPLRLIITVGSEALNAVAAQNFHGPILATMVLRSDAAVILASSGPRRVAAVYLDVPFADILQHLKALFPGKSRVGVIHARGAMIDAWQAQARQHGFAIETRECSGPEGLLKTLLSLKRKVDFVLLQPDSSLYNDATVRPLILASLENQLPVIGFSLSFVRAGAAIGIYPDYRDIGLQTAEAGRRYLTANPNAGDETPRKLVIAANQRVMRLVGLEYRTLSEYPVVAVK
jgi:putative tryptophan/tyrosine transport system substrate-binding protein